MKDQDQNPSKPEPTIEQQIVSTYAVLGECHTRLRQAQQVIQQMNDTINNHEKRLLHLMDQAHQPQKANE